MPSIIINTPINAKTPAWEDVLIPDGALLLIGEIRWEKELLKLTNGEKAMLTIAGKTYTVPGVYGTVEVITLGSVALPAFNNILIIGKAKKGIPYNATGKKGYEVIKPFVSLTDARDYYGGSELVTALDYAKRGGAGVVYEINVCPLTPASATIKDNAGLPANTFDVTPREIFYGAAGNDISVTMATASSKLTLTIIPPKLTKFLSTNASTTSKIVGLENLEGLQIGQSVYVADNSASAPQSTSITEIDYVNSTVTLNDLPTAAYATSAYARIYQENTDKQEVKTFESTATITDVIAWINSGQILTADRKNYAGVVPTTLTKTCLQNIASATKGTSPDATETTGGDYDLLAGSLPQLLEEFTNYTKVRMRLLNVVTPTATVHAVFKTLAQTLRTNQSSVQVVAGVANGDIDKAESDASHPIPRAKALNSADVILAGMGIDDQAAYITSAPLYAGMISGNSVKRNLTADAVNALSVEKFFGESNKETDTAKYLANGVLIFGTGKNGYYVVQGINTYQNQDTIWNEQDKVSYLTQQMQIVDYVYEGYKNQMNAGVGADGFDETAATTKGLSILAEYAAGGFITDYKIMRAYREGNAIITEPQITPLEATDFVGFVMKVLIPN